MQREKGENIYPDIYQKREMPIATMPPSDFPRCFFFSPSWLSLFLLSFSLLLHLPPNADILVSNVCIPPFFSPLSFPLKEDDRPRSPFTFEKKTPQELGKVVHQIKVKVR
jgi:hypothetical protein